MTDETDENLKIRQQRAITHYIKEWRSFYNLSTEGLGKRARLSGSYIAMLERGRTAYSQSSLERIAIAFKVEPWQLLHGGPDTAAPEKLDDAFWENIPSEHWKYVIRLRNHYVHCADADAKRAALEMFSPRPWKARLTKT